MIEARGISKQRGGRTLWEDLTFSVAAGEVVALTGPSGCGKSTLLDCVGHIDRVDSGTIRIGGVDAGRSARRARLLRRDHIGYLFQDFGLVHDATVGANVDLARPTGRGRRRGLSTGPALEQVGLGGRSTARAHELSGGEQQRVALARLLVKQPSVILADEPTSALDADNAALVLDQLESFAAAGAAVLIATHAPSVTQRTARVITLRDPRDHRGGT
ncbi:ATP-binding cassette domain-containing protein [Curtobacterium caseinilyticum]|uniref:ATP-binding cassette domain-containing protein n=1 Tax=Curtobacterium caseinilyticum TaxID=3055137 RepID=A0ABT7TRA2_9MICO|nr:ATP-binding cassette domain-containing protein [Curtobacterium caseinilyticum]MDM7892120.1 ATP-binding cassette domain-containing protein [Curtobacterium caseinilyticum]